MKGRIILISILVFVFMSFPVVWANENSVGESNSQIGSQNVANLVPLMKSSSSSGSKSSSSSSKTKVKDGDDDATATNETDSSNGGFPWWIIAIIVIVVLGIIGFIVWYLFLR